MSDDQVQHERTGEINAPAAEKKQPGKDGLETEPPAGIEPSFLSRCVKSVLSLSVLFKITGTFTVVLTLAAVSLGIVTFTRQKSMLQREMQSRASVLVQQLASAGKEALLTKQELGVFSIINDIQMREDVVYAMVVDDDGKVFAHSDMAKKATTPAGEQDLAALKAEDLFFQTFPSHDETVLDAAMPIALKAKNLKIGVARVALSQKSLNEAIERQKTLYIRIAAAFVLGGVIVSFALARLITRPLARLSRGMQVVTGGDLTNLVVVSSGDEIGKLTSVFNQMILSLREKIHMEKYLSQSTVRTIRENRDIRELRLGGERKYVTALFADARGFTSLSEQMSPEDVVGLLNIYLNMQTAVIHYWGGTVDKFVGDQVMAIFEGPENEINAVRAAVEIQSYSASLNRARAASGKRQIHIGIGLNSGDVIMGNMGSEDQMDYTVIGDNINIAARLCSKAQAGQVLVTRVVTDRIGDSAAWNNLPPLTVKGKEKPLEIAEILSVKGGTRRYMRKKVELPAAYSLIGDREETGQAIVKNLSPFGCLLQSESALPIGSQVRLELDLPLSGRTAIAATVHHSIGQETGLCFDHLQEEEINRIIQWIHQVQSEITGDSILV